MAIAPYPIEGERTVDRSRLRAAMAAVRDFVRRKPVGAAGAALVLAMVFAAALADVVAPYHPLSTDYAEMLSTPSLAHPLGTDEFGRDVLSRTLYGARTALLVGFVSALVGATVGLLIGVSSAYFGGRIDLAVQRIMDVFMSFPLIILALAVVAILGTGTDRVIMAITIPMVPRAARVCRASVLAIREMHRCCPGGRLSPRPHHAPPHPAQRDGAVPRHADGVPGTGHPARGVAVLPGLGVQEPTPAWGLMLHGGATQYAESAPWMAIFPGLAISAAVFAFNLFGDALRDVLDPRLRRL